MARKPRILRAKMLTYADTVPFRQVIRHGRFLITFI